MPWAWHIHALGLAYIFCCLISQSLYFPPFSLFSFSYKCEFWASKTSGNLLRDEWPVRGQPGSHYAKWLVISLRQPCCPEFAYVVLLPEMPFSLTLLLSSFKMPTWSFTRPLCMSGSGPCVDLSITHHCLWLSLPLHCEPLWGKNSFWFSLRIPAAWTCLTDVCWAEPPDG